MLFLKLQLLNYSPFCSQDAYGICMQAVNSDDILNVLETVKFVFCLQIHALAERIMYSKFSILHSATAASCNIENFSFIIRSARACICKQNTHNSL